MNEEVKQQEEEQFIPTRDLKFEMNQKVWFFLEQSLAIKEGNISGYFLAQTDEHKHKHYLYQIEYLAEQKDGTKKMMITAADDTEIFTTQEEANIVFTPLKKRKIKTALDNANIELKIAEDDIKKSEGNKQATQERIKFLEEEQKKL